MRHSRPLPRDIWRTIDDYMGAETFSPETKGSVVTIVRTFMAMSEQNRKATLGALSAFFCKECGYTTNGTTCHCSNDE